MKFPKPLTKGSTIGIVQPSGAISIGKYKEACEKIKGLGFSVYQMPEVPRKYGYLGGTDQQRVDELHHMFTNSDVDGIWCLRGGYGTQRYLHLLDYDLIAQHPKALIGFSDITALANMITREAGFITYHGIMGVSKFSDFDISIFTQVVIEQNLPFSLSPLQQHIESEDSAYHPFTINSGVALGELIGGNLAILASSLGTPYEIDFSGKILFLEDVGEAPYRIDRMLTQLIQAGKLDNVAGIALGIFNGCHPQDHDWKDGESLTLKEVLLDRLSYLQVPMIYGLPFGHIDQNATLPIGAKAKLDAKKMELTILGI